MPRNALPALLCTLGLACTSEPRLALAPLGTHQVQIGQTWNLQLEAQGALPPLQWRVTKGPAELFALGNTNFSLMTWTPSVFDLAGTKPGQPRVQGPVQPISIEVMDASGQTAQSTGSLQALPAPQR